MNKRGNIPIEPRCSRHFGPKLTRACAHGLGRPARAQAVLPATGTVPLIKNSTQSDRLIEGINSAPWNSVRHGAEPGSVFCDFALSCCRNDWYYSKNNTLRHVTSTRLRFRTTPGQVHISRVCSATALRSIRSLRFLRYPFGSI